MHSLIIAALLITTTPAFAQDHSPMSKADDTQARYIMPRPEMMEISPELMREGEIVFGQRAAGYWSSEKGTARYNEWFKDYKRRVDAELADIRKRRDAAETTPQ